MRLLVLNWQDRLNPQAGGAETHVHAVFGRLAARGHAVTLLASGWAGAAPAAELDGMQLFRTGSRYTYNVAAPIFYRRKLREQRYDVVVEALNKVPLFSPLWSGRPSMLLVHHLFGTTAFREASAPLAGMTWLLERPLGRVYRGVPAEAISRSTAEDLVERGLRERDIRVIPPGIDLEFFTPGPRADRSPEPTFLYLGRLKRYKGIELILQAIARMRADGVAARLLITGRGEWEAELRGWTERLQLGAQVEFVGFVTEEQKRELFRRCWANVFPSPKEGWGITNLEAAACGTPTVASDAPGLRESVVNGATGMLVPHGDVTALATALHRLALDRDLVERLGAGAREFAGAFSWERAADETEGHLSELCGLAARPADPPLPRGR